MYEDDLRQLILPRDVETHDTVVIRTAGFWRRLVAFLADAALVATVATIVGIVSGIVAFRELPARNGNAFDYLVDVANTAPQVLTRPLLLFGVLFVLHDVVGLVVRGTTPGRRALGLSVVGPGGRPPRPLRALLRSVLRVASVLALGAGCLWCLLSRRRRAWHDLLAGTWVERLPRP